ncbi:MAG: cation:proton antiporter [Bacteroidetes bacterium]|nr:cation:proton antiporter [Bacteroidota bacterium]
MNSYLFLIGLCIVIILSFFASSLAKKTSIPSALLLILLGVGIQQLLEHFKIEAELYSILEILGIIGLIMIVLEAALDLELSWSKWPLIWKSFTIAALSLGLTSFALSFVIKLFIPDVSTLSSIIYAIPVSILSSAIIIPSVTNLSNYKKEFMIYESTFSDILGIMVFYLIIENMNVEGVSRLSFTVGGNILMTLSISAVLSYVLLYIIQNIKGDAKFFLFLAVLILLYSIGKMFHLSSLIIILLFGLLLRNHKVLLFKKLEDWLYDDKIDEVYKEFRLITIETSFLVRTFFFVVFGMTLPLASLISWRVWIISVTFLAVAYMLRFLLFAVVERKDIYPQVFIAPRGLISILLFFAIPDSLKNAGIESGVLFVVIIATSIIMAMSLITDSRKRKSLLREKANASSSMIT